MERADGMAMDVLGGCLPAAIFLLLACFIPESPRWLAMKGKEEKAWNVLSKIGGDDYADQELRLVEETGSSKSEGDCGYCSVVRSAKSLFLVLLWRCSSSGAVRM